MQTAFSKMWKQSWLNLLNFQENKAWGINNRLSDLCLIVLVFCFFFKPSCCTLNHIFLTVFGIRHRPDFIWIPCHPRGQHGVTWSRTRPRKSNSLASARDPPDSRSGSPSLGRSLNPSLSPAAIKSRSREKDGSDSGLTAVLRFTLLYFS